MTQPSAARDMNFQDVFGFTPETLADNVIARAAGASVGYAGGLFPPGAAGIVRWIHTVAYAREELARFDYEPNNADQVARVVNRSRRIAIVPASGNQYTGLPFAFTGKHPSTKWPKGAGTFRAVERNVQLSLFGDDPEPPSGSLVTWMLLQFAEDGEIRSELSAPGSINSNGFITSWRQRFILPMVTTGANGIDIKFDDGGDGAGEIDIPIEPRDI